MVILCRILLGILLFVLLLLCYLLFSPVCYRIYANLDEGEAEAKVHDLLRLLHLSFQYRDGRGVLFGKVLYGILKIDEEIISQTKEEPKEKKTPKKTKKKPKKEKTKEKKEEKSNTGGGLKAMVTDGSLRDALPVVLSFIRKLILVLKPKKMVLHLRYSLGEPDLTGYLTGAASVLPLAYRKDVRLEADFSSDVCYAKGYVKLKGHVCLISLMILAIRLFFKKEIQQCMDSYKGVKKKGVKHGKR